MTLVQLIIIVICMTGAAYTADRLRKKKILKTMINDDQSILNNLKNQGMIDYTLFEDKEAGTVKYNITISNMYLTKIYADAEIQFIWRGVQTGLFTLADLSRVSGVPISQLKQGVADYEQRIKNNGE